MGRHVLRALLQRRQQLIRHREVHAERNAIMPLANLNKRSDRIRHDGRIRVKHKVAQHLDEARALRAARVRRVHLRDADRGGLAHIGVAVLERVSEGVRHRLCHDGERDVGHGADGERTDEGVLVGAVLCPGIRRALCGCVGV